MADPLVAFGLPSGGLLLYLYLSLCLYLMAKKLNYSGAWLAFIPLLNILVFLDLSGIGAVGCLILLVPLVNVIFMFYAWSALSARLGKSPWLVLLLLIPGLGTIILPTYLAFAD